MEAVPGNFYYALRRLEYYRTISIRRLLTQALDSLPSNRTTTITQRHEWNVLFLKSRHNPDSTWALYPTTYIWIGMGIKKVRKRSRSAVVVVPKNHIPLSGLNSFLHRWWYGVVQEVIKIVKNSFQANIFRWELVLRRYDMPYLRYNLKHVLRLPPHMIKFTICSRWLPYKLATAFYCR